MALDVVVVSTVVLPIVFDDEDTIVIFDLTSLLFVFVSLVLADTAVIFGVSDGVFLAMVANTLTLGAAGLKWRSLHEQRNGQLISLFSIFLRRSL